MTAVPDDIAARRTFVPRDIDLDDWSQIEPLYQQLAEREINSVDDAQQFLLDFSELGAVLAEEGALRRIAQSCHTDDKEIEERFLHWIENISPKTDPWETKLQQKLLDSPYARQLDQDRFGVMLKQWRADVELFREENIPLFVEVTKLNKRYDQIVGGMEIDFRGKTRTIQQMMPFLEDTDRDTREQAWRLIGDERLAHCAEFDQLFDQILEKRQKIATNAGMENYRDYVWKSYKRFDYTPQDCLAFGDAVAQRIVPLLTRVQERRKASLGLETLRPWDASVDELGRPPLRPFDAERIEDFVERTRRVFERIDAPLAKDFATLRMDRNLDLESRKGKRAGGYQSSLEERGEPFIFMNAAGLQRDVETLLHEGGHAFHYLWSRDEPVVFLRHAPLEFCEVASMSMELLAADHFDIFYDHPEQGDQQAARAKRGLIEGTLTLLPWIATIDGFQHWLYTHPGHSQDERTAAWLELCERFGGGVTDYTGIEPYRASMWQRQLHLYHYAFYYIEYGIAQLGALQLWLNYQQDPAAALERYRKGLSLGGTKPLPELFEAAGLKFDFTLDTIAPLADAVEHELDALPV